MIFLVYIRIKLSISTHPKCSGKTNDCRLCSRIDGHADVGVDTDITSGIYNYTALSTFIRTHKSLSQESATYHTVLKISTTRYAVYKVPHYIIAAFDCYLRENIHLQDWCRLRVPRIDHSLYRHYWWRCRYVQKQRLLFETTLWKEIVKEKNHPWHISFSRTWWCYLQIVDNLWHRIGRILLDLFRISRSVRQPVSRLPYCLYHKSIPVTNR